MPEDVNPPTLLQPICKWEEERGIDTAKDDLKDEYCGLPRSRFYTPENQKEIRARHRRAEAAIEGLLRSRRGD